MNTRNLTHRFLSMLLVLVMVFGMVPFQAFAADNAKAVDATIIFTDLHTGNGDYKESTVKGVMNAFKNSGLPFSSVTSGGDSFSSNESSYTAYTDTITGYIHNALGSNIPVSYVWSDHDRGAQNNSSSKTPLDKTSRLIYGAGNDGVYGTADDGNYYVYALSMADLCTYDRYSTGFNYTASSNNRAKNGYTSTVPQAIENFLSDAARLHKDRPLFIVSHQPLFDNRNDNGWAEDWCNAINEVGSEMDVAFFYGHNHKYDSGSDYYYAKGSTMPVATRKFTDGKDWNYNYQVGSGWQYDKDLASVNKVINFTHMGAGYLSPATESGTTRKGTAMAIAIYPDSIRYTTYNSNGIYTGSYAVDKTVPRDFAVTEEPVVPSEPAVTEPPVPSEPEATEPTAPSEPEATEPPVSDEVESDKVYVLVDAPVDGGKYLIVNQTLTNGDLSKDWDTDDDGMAVIRNGEGIAYSYAVPKAGTITDANGKAYTRGYIEYTDENAVWTVHASGNGWTIENDGFYLNKGSDNGVSASKNALTWNYNANGDDSRLYNGSDYLYFTYYGGDRGSWRWRTGTESGTSSTRDIFFYQEVTLTAPEPTPEPTPDPTPEFTPDSNDVVVGDGGYSYVKVNAASSLQEGYYQLQNNYTSKYLTSAKTSNANRLNLDSNGQNHIWYIKPVSGGYTIQYGGPNGQYLTFSHEKAAMSNNAQTVKILNTNGYWGIGATSGNPAAYLAREGTSNTSTSVHGYASNDYKYPGDVGMDWNLYERVENRKTYSVSASDLLHYLGQNDDQVQLTYALLVNGAAGTLPAGGSWNFSTHQDTNGIVKNISGSGVITFNKVEGSCYIKVAYTWSAGTAHMYVKVTAERDPNACEHSYESVTVNATCTADGSVTYTCTCGDAYVEVIKATGHDHKATVTAPTCTEGGYTTYTCHCGDTYTADKVAALGHDYKTVVTKPTCTAGGYTTYTCATCGHSYTADQVAALGHSYKSVTVQATCTADGSITHTCACGESYTEVIKATGHDYKAAVTAPTCTEGGYTTYTCHCGDTYVADEVEALGHTYQAKVTKPTCTEDGFTTYTCACGHSYTADVVAALGHSHKSVTVEATCTTDGSVTYTCVCGDSYVEVIKAHGHDYTTVVTVPTCTEAGFTTHTCATCGHSYTTDKVAALGHSYTSVVLAPTCIAEGCTVHSCTTCGHRYISDRVAALGHDYESVTVAPTCTADGSVTYTCHCGEFYVEVIEALGHNHQAVTVEATCAVDGSVTYTCHCGDSYAEVIKATGHDHKATVTAPTCNEAGYTTYTCHCGDSYVADQVAALGHKYESVTVKPACIEDGSVTYTCACGDSYTEVIKATGHDHKAVVTAPTCTEAGYTTYTCACGDTYTADEVQALGHDYKAVVTEPTCTEAGYTTYTCACGDTYTADEVQALGHDHKAVVTAPTCTEDGYTTYTCHCGDTYTTDVVAALGHDHESVTVEATCTADGSITYTCHCGDTYVEVIKALGHDYKTVVTEPTCTEAGYTTYTCAACGHSYTANKVAALGHTYESVTVEATCTVDGSVTYTCHCGEAYVEVIKAIGHDHKAKVTAPTCTEEGYTTYTCHCGDSYTADKVAALGHSYKSVTVKATCTADGSVTYTCACGEAYVEVIKAAGHDHKAKVTAPTCTEEGYTTYTCHCGDTYTADQVDALGHTYQTKVTAPTCTRDGYTTYACHCGDSYTADVVAALGHSHASVTVKATCAVDGSVTYTCACGDTYVEVIKAAGHDHEATVTAPTCTASGYTTYTCHCGDTYTADQVAALGHSYTCVDEGDCLVYTCSKCSASYTEVLTREWVKVSSGAYVLDTDGVDVGSNHKYIVVAADKDYAMTLINNNIGAAAVTIQNNMLTVSNPADYEFYFADNSSREKGSYLLTRDNSKSVYHVSSEIRYGHDSKGYWHIGSSSNGAYQLYDQDGSNWYLNYGYAWANDSVSRFAGSTNARSVRLFKYSDSYARLAGSIYQTFSVSDGATAASIAKNIRIETSTDGKNASGSMTATADMIQWNSAFNGNVPGVYTGTVTYQGVQLGTVKVTISEPHTYKTQVVAPTCTAEGYTVYTCTECGYSKTADYTPALGHSYSCVESDGYLHYTCHCGDSYSEKAVSFTQVSGISSGKNYVVTLYANNRYYALSHANNQISLREVSVSNGSITSEISNDLLWSYNGSTLSYKSNGTTYSLYSYSSSNNWWGGWWGSSATITLSISSSNSSAVSFSNNGLKIGSYYLNYSNGSAAANSSATTTYMFVEK